MQRGVVAEDADAEARSSPTIVRAAGGMPTRPMVAPPSSRPASEPSEARTGTRRNRASMAPTNSASARALAVRLRTTSTLRFSHASRSMFSEPALTRPTARSTGAKSSVSASMLTEAGTMTALTL
jgi:hypothetical protein